MAVKITARATILLRSAKSLMQIVFKVTNFDDFRIETELLKDNHSGHTQCRGE